MTPLLLVTSVTSVILAHSWYPYSCCSERDCAPTTSYERVEGGYMSEGVFFPDSIVKPSQDNQAHKCVNRLNTPLCFFIPQVGV